jgi:hypothetical protein
MLLDRKLEDLQIDYLCMEMGSKAEEEIRKKAEAKTRPHRR